MRIWAIIDGLFDKIEFLFKFYITPLVLLVFGIFALILPFKSDDIPSSDNTKEFSGTLSDYHFDKWGKGASDYSVIFRIEEYYNEFDDNFLTKKLCEKYLVIGKTKMKFYVDFKDTIKVNTPSRVGTYGTIIDDTTFQSKENAIKKQFIIAHYLLPVVGTILIILVVYFTIKDWRNYYRKAKEQ